MKLITAIVKPDIVDDLVPAVTERMRSRETDMASLPSPLPWAIKARQRNSKQTSST